MPRQSRCGGLRVAGAVLVAAGLWLPSCGAPSAPRNVVLLLVDTLRADHVHAYGYPRETSPAMDALAERGVRFAHAVSAWPETRQSMAALLSGLYAKNHGVVSFFGRPLPQSLRVLPEALHDAGFQTAAFIENAGLSRDSGYAQGFDVFELSREQPAGWTAASTLAIEWLRTGRDPGRPFFLWVHMNDPHARFEPPRGYHEMFVGDRHYDPSRRVEVRGDDRMHDAIGGFSGSSRLGERDELAYYVAQYDAEVRTADAKLSRVLAQLEELGLLDETLVILASDHGEGFGEHDFYWHGYVSYEEVMRVLLVIAGPGVARGVVEETVSLVDLAPTVLDLVGVATAAQADGTSLRPLLADPSTSLGRDLVFAESGGNAELRQTSVRDGRFKLIHVPDEYERHALRSEPVELYDLAQDPGETTNRAAEHPQVRARLEEALDAWRADASPPAPPVPVGDEERKQLEALGYSEKKP